VFRHLDQLAFERVLVQWFAEQGLKAEEAIAIDGKTLRGIHGEEVPGVHLVAAFANQLRTVLAQSTTEGKGKELAGVQAVLAALPARLCWLITGMQGFRLLGHLRRLWIHSQLSRLFLMFPFLQSPDTLLVLCECYT